VWSHPAGGRDLPDRFAPSFEVPPQLVGARIKSKPLRCRLTHQVFDLFRRLSSRVPRRAVSAIGEPTSNLVSGTGIVGLGKNRNELAHQPDVLLIGRPWSIGQTPRARRHDLRESCVRIIARDRHAVEYASPSRPDLGKIAQSNRAPSSMSAQSCSVMRHRGAGPRYPVSSRTRDRRCLCAGGARARSCLRAEAARALQHAHLQQLPGDFAASTCRPSSGAVVARPWEKGASRPAVTLSAGAVRHPMGCVCQAASC
jgi:hypothetical protein